MSEVMSELVLDDGEEMVKAEGVRHEDDAGVGGEPLAADESAGAEPAEEEATAAAANEGEGAGAGADGDDDDEAVAVAYDDIDQFEDSGDEVPLGETARYNDTFEDDFEDDEEAESEQQQEEEQPAEAAPQGRAEASMGTSPMTFDAEREEEKEAAEVGTDAMQNEGGEAAEEAAGQDEPPAVEGKAQEPAQAGDDGTGASYADAESGAGASVGVGVGPSEEEASRRPATQEEVVAVTANPLADLVHGNDAAPAPPPPQQQSEGGARAAEESASAVEQYKQYEQYKAGLDLERQLEKLDMQRKTSMEHISRDLFSASQGGVGQFHGGVAVDKSNDLSSNQVDTSYVAVPTMERVPRPPARDPPQAEWRPEANENMAAPPPRHHHHHHRHIGGGVARAVGDGDAAALETDLDKDLRSRLNMTDLEREQLREMQQQKQQQQQHLYPHHQQGGGVLYEMQNQRNVGGKVAGKVASTRTYLEGTIVPVLREAMKELARKRPDDPFEYLIEFLRRNKPQANPRMRG